MMLPMAEAAAAEDPEMAPKSMLAKMFTKARPPGILPTRARARLISRIAMPPLFMMLPARMKKGMASSAKLSMPVAIRWAKVVKAARGEMLTSMVRIPEIPMLKAMGTPSDNNMMKLTTSTAMPQISMTGYF